MGKIFSFYGALLFLVAAAGGGFFYLSRFDHFVIHSVGHVFCIVCVFLFLALMVLCFSEIQEYHQKRHDMDK